jgi:AraC family transcriptional regulator
MIEPDKIETIEDQTILFISKMGGDAKSPNSAWNDMRKFINTNQLTGSFLRYFGISYEKTHPIAKGEFRYEAAIVNNPAAKEKGELEEKVLRGGKYAVFTHKGKYSNLDMTFQQIRLKWLPKSKEKLDETRTSFCEYVDMEKMKTNPQELITKIYIPLL